MSKITKHGVCYDLTVSPFKYRINDLVYVFSSESHKQKFIEKYENNRKTLTKSLSNRFGFIVDIPVIADIQLYKKVETRGFLIVTNEGYTLCLNRIKLNGEKMTVQNCKEG